MPSNLNPNSKILGESVDAYRSVQNHSSSKAANKFIPRKGSVPLFKKIEIDFKKKEHDAVLNERK